MPSTHVSLRYHLVFSTKNREPGLPPSQRPRVHDYLGGIVRGLNGVPHSVGGMGDHVQVSRWIHNELKMPGFGLQEGYGAFSVSASSLDQVRTYVLRQEEHHRSTTFQQEFVAMLERGLVEYDERYLW
jgi:REP element-mobilizing transposase RayT